MHELTARQQHALDVPPLLAPAILAGGALNGVAVQIVQSWHGSTPQTIFLGISPFDVVTMVVATWLLIRQADTLPRTLGPLEIAALLLLLVPSSTISWFAVAAYASSLAWRCHGPARIGALLFVGLAVSSIWSSVGMRLFELSITSAEALVVSNILMLFRSDVGLTQNLIGVSGGHKVALFPACATAIMLPKAVVALLALATALGTISLRRTLTAAIVAAIVLAALNWSRLAGMAWSAEHYAFWHGPIGANIFDLAQSVILFAGAWLAIERNDD